MTETIKTCRNCKYYKDYESDFDNQLFWERNFYPDVNTIVWDLYKRGLIEECEYMIDIDW